MIASLTFTSCEDFLTEEVRGQQNLDTYFQSAEEAEAFITGCYQAITFGGWWNINTVWLLSEMCSDDGWMGNTSQSQSDYISLAHYQGYRTKQWCHLQLLAVSIQRHSTLQYRSGTHFTS